jgi:hypothetical protein
MVTEILGKKKVMVKKDHIGLNIKETESDLSMVDRLELERHLLSVLVFWDQF